jgi:hypothetical protein
MYYRHTSILAVALLSLAAGNTSGLEILKVVKTQPASAWRDSATLEVAISGSGFGLDSVVRFLVAGTDDDGGISVKRAKLLSSQEVLTLVEIDALAKPGEFDVEVQDGTGRKARARSVFVIKPYSWSERFGCTGAESWRRRIPCRRGAID